MTTEILEPLPYQELIRILLDSVDSDGKITLSDDAMRVLAKRDLQTHPSEKPSEDDNKYRVGVGTYPTKDIDPVEIRMWIIKHVFETSRNKD